ncbi:Nidogen-2 [Camelus dromedarius]|uniref:Nidogen-2 n=1 Tax=Camelus dromedarius TaxID=9838 RepID=A0A5N4E2H0_CAMDR|nr:Nidogen-2 [Camelus dromedarius]
MSKAQALHVSHLHSHRVDKQLDSSRNIGVNADTSSVQEVEINHAAALEGDYTEDNLDYYDENEEEVEYPPGEPEEASNGHSTMDVSFHSKADSRQLGAFRNTLLKQLLPWDELKQALLPNTAFLVHLQVAEEGPRPVKTPGRERLLGLLSFPVFTYNAAHKETCEHNHERCSRHAFCTDYATGFCCHCQSRFYGNGKHCLPEGAPHRVNGKVSGQLRVGHMPVHFTDVDLHAYIVGNDGRAYTAISHIPQPAAQALLPLTPIGGLFGWLFALEKPGWENGFSLTGATFIHDMEVTFYPGEERVRITQTAEGLDPENYLSIKTNIQGQVPYIPANFTAHIAPYRELYHYSDSVVTSTSSRDYSLTFGTINQTQSYRVHQNITYQTCRHAPRRWAVPTTQQLNVDRVFALYTDEEKVLRFAVTNQIGPVEGMVSFFIAGQKLH